MNALATVTANVVLIGKRTVQKHINNLPLARHFLKIEMFGG